MHHGDTFCIILYHWPYYLNKIFFNDKFCVLFVLRVKTEIMSRKRIDLFRTRPPIDLPFVVALSLWCDHSSSTIKVFPLKNWSKAEAKTHQRKRCRKLIYQINFGLCIFLFWLILYKRERYLLIFVWTLKVSMFLISKPRHI